MNLWKWDYMQDRRREEVWNKSGKLLVSLTRQEARGKTGARKTFLNMGGKSNILYIRSGHCSRNALGLGLFDHQKVNVTAGCFCWFFSLFVIFCYFFTVGNFCKLFFIVQRGKSSCFNLFFDCSGGRGCAFIYLFILIIFLPRRGRGWRLMFFFLLYIWFEHSTRNARGWGIFNHQKGNVMWGCFCWLFITFFYYS
jgi:hypothetical protein